MMQHCARAGSCSRMGLRNASRPGLCGLMQHVARPLSSIARGSMSDTAVFIEEIAVTQTPKHLAALTKVLEVRGGSSVAPGNRDGLHPLLIPFSAQGDTITCLLRWPDPFNYKTMPLPVVTMKRGALNMLLVARSVDEYLHRLLAEENAAGGPAPLAEAAGADGQALFKAGDIEAAGMAGKLPMYLIRKAGMFPDVCEGLSMGHLQRNDKTSAMVASEWYMRNNHFPGWGRPYEYAAELFTQLKRDEEARDFARFSLRCPWWTLSKPFVEIQATAQLPGTPEHVMWMLSEEAAAASSAAVNKFTHKDPKTPQQLAMERATKLMNNVAAGIVDGGYASIRVELAEAYKEAGFSDVANFISSS